MPLMTTLDRIQQGERIDEYMKRISCIGMWGAVFCNASELCDQIFIGRYNRDEGGCSHYKETRITTCRMVKMVYLTYNQVHHSVESSTHSRNN